uniref:Glucose/Sorbosone dehydrogenase domain-containing protein n=1 Tax=Spongospora subterranea TaxID=70186 RepID=A0A0H5RS33_9EUKA|eukprot:CRZ11544.1 hypothetical protein [Spongospora subterranea]
MAMISGIPLWIGVVAIFMFIECRAVIQDPSLYSESVLWSGTNRCVKYQVTRSGQIFCGDKDGIVRMFPSITSSVEAGVVIWTNDPDLTATWGDRGLLGMAVDQNYPDNPYIWVLVSVNRLENLNDNSIRPNNCGVGDGGGIDGSCDAAARLIRIKVNNNVGVTDQILMSGWCSNGMSHHIGNLAWAKDGGMFLSGGDGSSYTVEDRGTMGAPCHRDGDTRPQGAWRSQWEDYTHGKILYISKNDLMGNTVLTLGNGARVVAKGLRNPFRFAIHPVTNDLYVGDVGSIYFEEINIIPNPLATSNIPNFGWPCFEGPTLSPMYGADSGCSSLQSIKPWMYYSRSKGFSIPGAQEHCMRGSVSPSAFAFHTGTVWGSAWENRLVWADSSMQCVFTFENTAASVPDLSKMSLISYNDGAVTADINIAQNQWVDFFFTDTGNTSALYAANYHQSALTKINYIGSRFIVPKSSSTKLSSKTVFIIIIVVCAALLLLAIIVFALVRRHQRKSRFSEPPQQRRSIALEPLSPLAETIRNRPISTRNKAPPV